MSSDAVDVGLALLPWIIVAAVLIWRARGSRYLDAESDQPPVPAPSVSIIIPARDEARNIGRCLRSVLLNRYPALDIIVVDDHSTDGTGELARLTAAGDARVRVVVPPALPQGWFGKSWACAHGAAHAHGELLLFIDADTTLAADLVVRLVNAQRSRNADLISIGGRQELGSFWERVVQPLVFTMILARFGSTERVSRSRRAMDKIANGQCILVRRDAYHEVGGHAKVRDKVAEDLMLAQTFFRAGKAVWLVLGVAQMSTRMYTSLGELVRGWGKNIYAGAVEVLPLGGIGRAVVIPLLLVAPAVLMLIPPTSLVLSLTGIFSYSAIPAAAVTLLLIVLWGAVYRAFGLSPMYGVLYPLGAIVLLYIVLAAISRGREVSWKGRRYRAW